MISTHILDTSLGQPASAVRVQLLDGTGQLLATALTNADGRISDFQLPQLSTGPYALVFQTQAYFERSDRNSFFPSVAIHFFLDRLDQHYHIPLLISPFAYSTYRGS